MSSTTRDKQGLLAGLPSVDELLKTAACVTLLTEHPRSLVLQAVRDALAQARTEILGGRRETIDAEALFAEIALRTAHAASYSLRPLINATGIVLHTNLGRAVFSDRAVRNMVAVASGYSNLEYDLEEGRRGKRHVHLKSILRRITGAEDALVVNNNAAAVFLCLNTFAKGREVIVSRGELVEIGGSFRVPDVMAASGAILREVGTTNKTHLHDYSRVLHEQTGLLLKVHQSNYRIVGFTQDVTIEELAALGKQQGIPVMYDLGSGSLFDMREYGIFTEPTVQEIVRAGIDLITFSGDKLLGGPQGGIILGRKDLIDALQKNPMARAFRIDKLTIAAFEATLSSYLDPDRAKQEIPVLNMLLQPVSQIHARARKLFKGLKKRLPDVAMEIKKDVSQAGGGSIPETSWETYVIAMHHANIAVNDLESRLRFGTPSVIARIKNDMLLLDARTIADREIQIVINSLAAACSS